MSEPRARLLVVDDNEDNRDLLARRLERRGFEVDVAEDGVAALAAASQVSYDLVLLDIMMPGMSGIEVLNRLRQTRSKAELPILMATAKTESQDVIDALAMGANDYVTKPIDFPVALARIESHLLVRKQMVEAQPKAPILSLDGTVAPGTVFDERYEILSVIGEGGFAVVFKARQLSTGQIVALKLLRAHRVAALALASVERKRFVREMKLIGQLQHPHIVRLVDSGSIDVAHSGAGHREITESQTVRRAAIPITRVNETPEPEAPLERTMAVPYLVMEFLDGRPLSAILRERGPFSTTTAVDLLVPMLSAVGEAHRSGVVHRDLKPPNIMVMIGPNGGMTPKVLDFGIAKLLDEETSDFTQDTGFVGTPEYMSPEQARGSREVTPKTDQYALAVILYECLTGRRPFESDSFIELVHLISKGSVLPPSELVDTIPQALEAVILRAMYPDPDARFRSLEAFGAALLPFASVEVAAQWAPAFEPGSSSAPPGLHLAPDPVVRSESGVATERTTSSTCGTLARSRSSRRRAVAALVITSFFGLGAAVMAPLRDASRDPDRPSSYLVDVRVTPGDAEIVLDKSVAGVGRLRRPLRRDGAAHTLRISAPGYVPQTFTFTDVPPPDEVALERLGGTPAPTGSL